MRCRQRVNNMVNISNPTIKQNTEVNVGESRSVWVEPRCGGGGVGWCDPYLCLRWDWSSCTRGGGVVGPAETEGPEGGGHTSAHSTDSIFVLYGS